MITAEFIFWHTALFVLVVIEIWLGYKIWCSYRGEIRVLLIKLTTSLNSNRNQKKHDNKNNNVDKCIITFALLCHRALSTRTSIMRIIKRLTTKCK
jgi:hypothetical protein